MPREPWTDYKKWWTGILAQFIGTITALGVSLFVSALLLNELDLVKDLRTSAAVSRQQIAMNGIEDLVNAYSEYRGEGIAYLGRSSEAKSPKKLASSGPLWVRIHAARDQIRLTLQSEKDLDAVLGTVFDNGEDHGLLRNVEAQLTGGEFDARDADKEPAKEVQRAAYRDGELQELDRAFTEMITELLDAIESPPA